MSHPTKTLPLLPLRDGVLLPGALVTIPVGRESSVALVRAVEPGSLIVVAVQRDAQLVEPALTDLQSIAVLARVHRVARLPKGYQIVLEGLSRVQVERFARSRPFIIADVFDLDEVRGDDIEREQLARALREELSELDGQAAGGLQRLIESLADVHDEARLADRTASALGLPIEKEVHVLVTTDVLERLRLVLRFVIEAKAVGEVKSRIDNEVRKEFHKGQREAVLREQLKAIQKELGQGGPTDDLEKLRERLAKADLPEEVRTTADRELARLSGQASGPEQGVIRNYLEWIADLPWNVRADANTDLNRVQEKLDADHAGLVDVKKRILEHLAVLQVAGNAKGTILCLAGPPGVGKTSLGQSIADALGRPFVRVALGGVRDEAEVRGHRRTYVGALPGRIVNALKKAKAKNPVFLLDEIDKLGRGWAGDPAAALLEVLDPEQNGTFTDHYMELPFDLSEVLFICTVNDLDALSPPLRDRLEVIELQGYTADEKMQIARKHLIPKKLADHGISEEGLTLTDEALQTLISGYTREAGVRQLQREITKLCRGVALEVAKRTDKDKKLEHLHLDVGDLHARIGRVKFFNDTAERTMLPGVATGLAWTPVGGDILFIETSRMPGKGQLDVTGQLGDVMKESARAAMTYVRSHAQELGIDPAFFEGHDLHIHIPAGAVPKDGPSAGVTMFTALASLLTGRKVRSDTAMTGEATLRGRVLPVGGIKSKVLAAHRAGLTRVILPKQNARDLDEVPEEVRHALELIFAEDMAEVLHAALEEEGLPLAPGTLPGGGDRPAPTPA
jgi:ATP-dependent Lon protease